MSFEELFGSEFEDLVTELHGELQDMSTHDLIDMFFSVKQSIITDVLSCIHNYRKAMISNGDTFSVLLQMIEHRSGFLLSREATDVGFRILMNVFEKKMITLDLKSVQKQLNYILSDVPVNLSSDLKLTGGFDEYLKLLFATLRPIHARLAKKHKRFGFKPLLETFGKRLTEIEEEFEGICASPNDLVVVRLYLMIMRYEMSMNLSWAEIENLNRVTMKFQNLKNK